MKNTKKITFGIINILIYIFLPLIISSIVSNFNLPNNKLLLNFILLIAPIISLIILVTINKDLFKNKLKDLKLKYKKYFGLALKYYICGLLLMIISNNIINLLLNEIPINESLNRQVISNFPIYAIISMVLIIPLSEEITFRGSFKNGFNNKQLYLLITSLIFGLIHVIFNGDYIYIIPYSCLGYFLGKIYYETDNIYMSYIAHSFHNFLCILLIVFGGAIWKKY